MGQQFIKGKTNQHLTWVMVDSTDFASPESALSAATKIKIYGKLAGATGTNFVSSGTGSLTNDIQHVGASALGIYTIALAKADLSDASAAWYDQYIISLSATGAAYQTLIVDGGIWISDLSAIASDIRSDVSDMHSDLMVMSGILSDAMSMLTAQSDAISNVMSAVLLTQSLASDAHSAAAQVNSRALVIQSMVSDVDSALTSRFSNLESLVGTTGVQLNASSLSDLRSAIAGITATISASDMSDIASRVWSAKYNAHSVASSFGSLFERVASSVSDLDSRISSTPSTKSQLASATYALMASQLSDVLSAAQQVNSRVLVAQSFLSDIRSDVSDMHSDLIVMSGILSDTYSAVLLTQSLASDAHSAAVVAQALSASDLSDIRSAIAAGPAATVTASDISDIASAVWAYTLANKIVTLNSSDLSDIRSAIAAGPAATVTASDISDIASAVRAIIGSDLSDILSAVRGNSDAASNILSMLTLVASDTSNLLSMAGTTGFPLNASTMSDLRSAITAGPTATVTASDISDIASAVWAYTLANKTVTLNSSDMSDLRSAITAGGGGGAGVTASDISDIASAVKVAIDSQLSDILSAAQQTNSRALVLQSMVSDVDSALTSRFSNLESLVGTTGVQVNASSLSDIRSAITANALTASQVKVQVVNALSVDTYAEPGQGAPAATAPLSTKIGHLYKLSRNKITQDATTLKVFADNGTTVDAKATVSDDGSEYTRGELVTGP